MKEKLFDPMVSVLIASVALVALAVPIGIVGGAPHTSEHAYDLSIDDRSNMTFYIYDSEEYDSNHYPGSTENNQWFEIIKHNLGEDNKQAWVNKSFMSWPWVANCGLDNLVAFTLDDRPPENGTGGGTQDYYLSETEGLIPTVDADASKDLRGEAGIEAYQDWLDDYGGHEKYQLATTDWDEEEHVRWRKNGFWSPSEAEGEPDKNVWDWENFDRVILDQEGCFTNPEKAGWYRMSVTLEEYWLSETDTPTDDQQAWAKDEQFPPLTFSHWVYICQCDSYDDAVDALGTPPGYFTETSGNSPTDTPETATPTPEVGETETPTPTPEVEETETATPTPEVEETATPTSDEEETATPTLEVEETDTETDGPTADATQPGFGVVAMILATLGGLLITRIYR